MTPARQPDPALDQMQRAIALVNANELLPAAQAIDAALALQPQWFEALNLKAVIAARLHRVDQARVLWEQMLQLRPDDVQTLSNLGNLHSTHGQPDLALPLLQKAAELSTTQASVFMNLGVLYTRQKRHAEGEAAYRKALSLDPRSAQTHFNLGRLCELELRLDEACEHYRQALAIDPQHRDAAANLLFTRHYQVPPDPAACRVEADALGTQTSARAPKFARWLAPAEPERALRIGFVSGDLSQHPVTYFLEPLLRHLHPPGIELYAYSNGRTEDAVSTRIRPEFAQWRPVWELSDAALARQIHEDRIDVLIDLAGFSAANRLRMFACRPAPVQVAWLGYFATTGLPEIDWIIGDPVCTPPSEEALYREKVWRLPHSRLLLFEPAQRFASPLPAAHPGRPFTFGCFQQLPKINSTVVAAWGRILAACPAAQLRLQPPRRPSAQQEAALRVQLRAAGVGDERVTIVPPMALDKYLRAYAEVDIALDTFPYPGGTTTVEALWMGVPSIACISPGMLGRQGEQLLRAAGLGDWVCADVDAYVALATRWGRADGAMRQTLAQLRAQLPERLRQAEAADPVRFAAELLAALRGMWRAYCSERVAPTAHAGRPASTG